MAFKSLTGFDASNQPIVNVADPSSASDAATKAYVDNSLLGLRWKEPVRAATTANVTLSGTQTIDSVALTAGQRVLVKNQTDASENGIYVVAAGAWSRATDANTVAKLDGAAVTVLEGTANGDTSYTQTATITTLDTDDVTWAQFNGGGTTYTAGSGLTESPAGTFNVVNTDGALTVGANSVDLASQIAGSGLALSAGALAVNTGTGLEISSDAVALAASAAGAGLTHTTGVLAVGAGTGITVNADDVAVDNTVVVRKYSTAIGNGSSTSITVTHGLNTKDITWSIRTAADDSFVVADVVATSTTQATFTFAVAPTTNQYTVTIHG